MRFSFISNLIWCSPAFKMLIQDPAEALEASKKLHSFVQHQNFWLQPYKLLVTFGNTSCHRFTWFHYFTFELVSNASLVPGVILRNANREAKAEVPKSCSEMIQTQTIPNSSSMLKLGNRDRIEIGELYHQIVWNCFPFFSMLFSAFKFENPEGYRDQKAVAIVGQSTKRRGRAFEATRR